MALEKMKFYLVKPQAATNYVTNPTPYLATTGYTALTGTIALSDTYTRRGPMCIAVTPTIAESGVYFSTISVTDTQVYAFSVDVKGETGKAMRIQVEDAGATYTYETTFTATGEWQRVAVTFTAQETAADYRLYVIRDATAGTTAFYVDGFQFEDTEETTFFSGDMLGFGTGKLEFGWNGTPHASTSYRTVNTNAGGKLVDIDDYATLAGIYGLGAGTYQQLMTPLISGGSYYQGFIRKSRIYSLLLDYTGSMDDIQTNRQSILDLVRPSDQRMVVRYQGFAGIDGSGDAETEPVDIVCVPQPSHGDPGQRPAHQQDLLNFTIPSGLLDGAYKEGAELGTGETIADADYIIQRDVDSEWSAMGSGMNGAVYKILKALDGKIYAGGAFTLAGGVANTAYIAYWDGTAWNPLDTGLNGAVWDMAEDASGNIYVVGVFTDAGGVAAADYIAKWDGAAWSAVGTPIAGSASITAVYGVEISSTGDIFVGGDFTTFANVTSADYIARWNGSAWLPLYSPFSAVNNIVYGIKRNPLTDVIYIYGAFTLAMSDNDAAYLAKLNVGNLPVQLMDGALSGTVYAVEFDNNGNIYAGGAFTNGRGNADIDYITKFNGTQYLPLLSGLDGNVRALSLDDSGLLHVGGDFTNEGLYYVVWNGTDWLTSEVSLPGAANVRSIECSGQEVYIGYSTAGSATTPEATAVSNNGDINTYPLIKIVGPGAITHIRNNKTERIIKFSGLTLQAGETLKINLNPNNLFITSNWRGNCLQYVARESNIGDFIIEPGSNNIAMLMSGTTAATKTYIEYTPQFDGIEGAKHD